MMLIGDQTLHMSAYIDKDISTWMDFDLLKLHYSKKILSIGVKISMPRHKHLSCRLEGKQTYCLLEMLISLVRFVRFVGCNTADFQLSISIFERLSKHILWEVSHKMQKVLQEKNLFL